MVIREDKGYYRSILFFYSFFWAFLNLPVEVTLKYKYHFLIVKGQHALLLFTNPVAGHRSVLRGEFPSTRDERGRFLLDVCLFYGTLEQFFVWIISCAYF